MHAGARPHVDHVVGGEDRVAVVLHHHHRVTEVAELAEGGEETRVVALVEADRRLVQDVEHADQLRADLGREPDALALATRERRRAAIERQVIEPDVDQEAEARQDLLHDRARDLALGGRESEAAEEGERIADGKRRHLDDAPPPDAHEARLTAEPRALAGRAPPVAHQAFQLLPEPGGARLLLAAPAEREEARERPADGAAAVLELDLLLPRALEQDGAHGRRQILEGRARAEAVLRREAREHRLEPRQRAQHHGGERVGERRLGPGDDQRRIEAALDAEPAARRAGAVRAVEGEEARRELRVGDAARRAGVPFAEEERARRRGAGLHHLDQRRAVAVPEGDRERVREARRHARAHDQAIDQHLDRVPHGARERDVLGQLAQRAVHAHAHEAAAAELVELLAVLALAVADDGRVDEEPRVGRERRQPVYHLLHRLRRDLAPAGVAERAADAGVEEAEVVRDLGHRADGRARVPSRPFRLDRDRRREALDGVAVGLLHLLEELARVGGEGLDVAALALGVERVEGERGLARAREARDHDQPVARDLDVDVLEVVLAGPTHEDAWAPHGACWPRGDPARGRRGVSSHAPRTRRAAATSSWTIR